MAEGEGVAGALTKGTVKLPGIGPVKKVYVYVGVGAVGVLTAYIIWKRQQAASDVAYADADLGDGLTTGAGSDVYQGANAGGANSGDSDVLAAPTTNQEWTSRAVEYFNWLEPGYVTSTIGKYLSRVGLSSEEADLIRQIWAAIGKPPEGPSTFTLTSDTNTPGAGTNPSAPANLRLVSVNNGNVSLDWDEATDATGYQVFRNGVQVGPTGASNYVNTGLPAGTYSFTVKATNGSKISAASNTVSATVPTVPKTPPKTTPAKNPEYFSVTVVAFHEKNPAWNSTLNGIASKYKYTADQVWNNPKNIGLRSSRKSPNLIRAGDKVWVKRR